MTIKKRISVVLAIAATMSLAPASSLAEIVVSYFEPLQQLNVAPDSIRFAAMGREFDLQLETNDRILSGLNSNVRSSDVKVYRGQLAAKPGSWVRIVVFNGMPSGLIWDGSEMFAIEPPDDSSLNASSPVVYRLSDSHIAPGTISCGSDFLQGNTAAVFKSLGAATKAAVAKAPGAVSEITMSAIGDYEFTDAKGGDAGAVAAITTRLNNVDGFFSEQVGVQINVQLIETHSDPDDPFGDTLVAGELLDELSEYQMQTPAHNSMGLTHLFTGRNLDTTTVGIAWRGTLCDDYFSTGLTEGRTNALNDSLIAAHEIGHNFNARHDGESGSGCESETAPFIMSPSITGSQIFSACSIDVMQAEVLGASCVAALPAVDVGIQAQAQPSNVLLGANFELVYVVSSNGTLDVPDVVANFTLPNTLTFNSAMTTLGACTNGAGTVSCDIGNLPGSSSETITISVTPSSVGVGLLTASVSTSGADERLVNNQSAIQVSVDPAVDLVVNEPPAIAVFINQATTINGSLDNLSILDASNVSLSISLEVGLQANSASWSIGTCTVAAQQVDCIASAFSAQSSSTFSVTATGTTEGRKDVTVSLSAAEADANPANNSVVGEVRVTTPNDDKDDGGGAGNPFVLFLLALTVFARRARP
jgi:hypothetical protein